MWKDAEILLPRHQLAAPQRQTAVRPRLTWTGRALLAVLLTLIPRSRHGALRLFITPATILRWHRDIVRRRWAAKSKPKRPGLPPTCGARFLDLAWLAESSGLGSSLSDLLKRLPSCTLPVRLGDGAGPA
jgi:hypothetical protein